jgi:hypothetical protein
MENKQIMKLKIREWKDNKHKPKQWYCARGSWDESRFKVYQIYFGLITTLIHTIKQYMNFKVIKKIKIRILKYLTMNETIKLKIDPMKFEPTHVILFELRNCHWNWIVFVCLFLKVHRIKDHGGDLGLQMISKMKLIFRLDLQLYRSGLIQGWT